MTPCTVEQFKSREEWLAARRSGIGGSDIPALLGLSPWKSPLLVWNDKVGIAEAVAGPEAEESRPLRLRLGTKLEPVIAEVLEEEAGVKVSRLSHAIVRDPDYRQLLCSPDGFGTTMVADCSFLVELKSADSSKADEWEEGVPQDYVTQVQHNLGVTRLPGAYIGCLIGGTRDFRWAYVERDDAMIADLRERALAFWECVRTETMPEPTGSEGDTKALNARYPRPAPGKSVSLPADMLELTWDLQRMQAQAKELEEAIDQKKNVVRAAIADAEEGVLPSGEKWTWKTQARKSYVVQAAEFRVLRAPKMK